MIKVSDEKKYSWDQVQLWSELHLKATLALEVARKENRDSGFPWWVLIPIFLGILIVLW